MVDNPLPEKIDIVMIKGRIPNFITARAAIAQLQTSENTRAESAGEEARKVIYCQFCGRSQKSMQGLRAHLRHCRGKLAYKSAISDGVTFHIADHSFTVAARSIKLLTGLEKYEGLLNKMVQEDSGKFKVAVLGFNSLIHGAKLAEPEGWVRLVEHPRLAAAGDYEPRKPDNSPEPAAARNDHPATIGIQGGRMDKSQG